MTDNRTTERVDHPPRVRETIDELMREKDAADNRTTELRRLLTERGIEYETNDHMGACETSWNGFTVMQLTPSAKLIMTVTPEQAIAATLENPTCEYVIEDNMNETEGMGDVWFRCTNCDMCYDYADDWLLKMPHCPKCGATVKGVR